MQAIRNSLFLVLSILPSPSFASIVPITNEVVATSFQSDGRSNFVEGFVQLNKTKGTINLVLQPPMPPCPSGQSCTEVMPAPYEYFLEDVKSRVDECDAVIYEAQQSREETVRVLLIDNTAYNYERCPTFLPVPETVVQVEQIVYGPSTQDEKTGYFTADALTPVRY